MNRITNYFKNVYSSVSNTDTAFHIMKLHFLFFLGSESSTTEGASVEVSEEITSEVDFSWKNSDAFKLPKEISLRTE